MKGTTERLQNILEQFETLDVEGKQFVVENMKREAAGRDYVIAFAEALEQCM